LKVIVEKKPQKPDGFDVITQKLKETESRIAQLEKGDKQTQHQYLMAVEELKQAQEEVTQLLISSLPDDKLEALVDGPKRNGIGGSQEKKTKD